MESIENSNFDKEFISYFENIIKASPSCQFILKNEIVITKNLGESLTKKISKQLQISNFNLTQNEILCDLQKNLENYKTSKENLKEYIKTFSIPNTKNIGDQFDQFDNVLKLLSIERTKLIHNPGQIYIIRFWKSSHNTALIKYLKELQEIKQKDWQDKVLIITINGDSNVNITKEKVVEREFTDCFINYFIKNFDSAMNPALDYYLLKPQSKTLVIDPQGKISFFGNIFEIDLEKFIDKMIKNEKTETIDAVEFKKIKKFIEHEFEFDENLNKYLSVNFVVDKNKYFDKNFNLIEVKIEKPTIVFEIKTKYLENLKIFFERFTKELSSCVFVKCYNYNLKTSLKENCLKLFEIFNESDLQVEAFSARKEIFLNKNNLTKVLFFENLEPYNISFLQKVEKANRKIKLYNKNIEKKFDKKIFENFEIEANVNLGSGIYEFLGQNILKEEDILVSHIPGQAMIITFWNSWNEECLETLELHNKWINNNESWTDKLKYYSIIYNDDPSLAKSLIFENGWTKFINISLNSKEEIEKIYSLRLLPYSLLVNTQGQVCFIGPSQELSEEKINLALFEKEFLCPSKKNSSENNLSCEQYNKIIVLVKLLQEQINNKIDPNETIEILLEKFYEIKKNNEIALKFNAKGLKVIMSKKNYPVFEKTLQEILEICPLEKWSGSEIKLFEMIPFTLGEKCNKCELNIKLKRQFWCWFCKIYFCEDCVKNEGHDEHNLVFFFGDGEVEIERVESWKLEKSKFEESICKGCSERVYEGVRWICLNCNTIVGSNVELCEKCMEIYMSHNSKYRPILIKRLTEIRVIATNQTDANEFEKELLKTQHNEFNHAWLRVPFNKI